MVSGAVCDPEAACAAGGRRGPAQRALSGRVPQAVRPSDLLPLGALRQGGVEERRRRHRIPREVISGVKSSWNSLYGAFEQCLSSESTKSLIVVHYRANGVDGPQEMEIN